MLSVLLLSTPRNRSLSLLAAYGGGCVCERERERERRRERGRREGGERGGGGQLREGRKGVAW